jgi:hypothetical protein
MKLRLPPIVLILLASRALAETSTPLMTFAYEGYFSLLVGEYQPPQGWVEANDIEAPKPGSVFTLFVPTGRIGEVKMLENRMPLHRTARVSWGVPISRWDWSVYSYALGLEGRWPDPVRTARAVPLDDPMLVSAVSGYLKTRRLNVERPFLTEAWRIDLDGDGSVETLVCAHNDASAVKDDQAADIYALALLFTSQKPDKPVVLAQQTSHKTSRQTMDQHEHYYRKRDFYRFLSFVDVTGNGKLEIAFYNAKDDATEISLFTFDGKSVSKVLSAYKPHYQ